MRKIPKIRLYLSHELRIGAELAVNEDQARYLLNVMKLGLGDTLLAFDNKSGEYLCKIIGAGKKQCLLKIEERTRPYELSPDLWLLFAPVKKDRTDFIIEKATELGVRAIFPVITRFTISEKARIERYAAQSIEAAEQSRRVDLPEIHSALTLEKLLAGWKKNRVLFYMDETHNGEPVYNVFEAYADVERPAAVLVGPEGGFSEEELKMLRQKDFTVAVNLGPRILRAETAVVAALSCWQAICGDWH